MLDKPCLRFHGSQQHLPILCSPFFHFCLSLFCFIFIDHLKLTRLHPLWYRACCEICMEIMITLRVHLYLTYVHMYGIYFVIKYQMEIWAQFRTWLLCRTRHWQLWYYSILIHLLLWALCVSVFSRVCNILYGSLRLIAVCNN